MTTRIICGSTHGVWDEWGAHCSICHPARYTCADEGTRYSSIRCPVHGAAVTHQPDPRDADLAAHKRALAAGAVVVPREVVERVTEWVRDAVGMTGGTRPMLRCASTRADGVFLLADLDMLLKKGGG